MLHIATVPRRRAWRRQPQAQAVDWCIDSTEVVLVGLVPLQEVEGAAPLRDRVADAERLQEQANAQVGVGRVVAAVVEQELAAVVEQDRRGGADAIHGEEVEPGPAARDKRAEE